MLRKYFPWRSQMRTLCHRASSQPHLHHFRGKCIVTMDKVKPAVRGNIPPQRMGVTLVYLVPAHVRNLQNLVSSRRTVISPQSAPPCRVQCPGRPRPGSPHFHPAVPAYPEQTPSNGLLADTSRMTSSSPVFPSSCMQSRIAPTPGKTTRSAARISAVAAGYRYPVVAGNVLHCLGNGVQVTHSVINDCNRCHSS